MIGPLLVFLGISFTLIVVAVIAAKRNIMEIIITPAFWTAAVLLLWANNIIHGLIFGIFKPYTLEELEGPFSLVFKNLLSEYNSVFFTAKSLAVSSFGISLIGGLMYLVSKWIEDDEKAIIMGVGFLFWLVIAAIFAIGFIKFFEGVALILGIIGTIIGILVGIKKLSQR